MIERFVVCLSLCAYCTGGVCNPQTEGALSRTISPIGEMSTTANPQAYTSDFFNSILGTTTATTAAFDVTAQGTGSFIEHSLFSYSGMALFVVF